MNQGDAMKSQKIKDPSNDDTRLSLIIDSITPINDTLFRFEKRFEQSEAALEERFNQTWRNFNSLDDKSDRIDAKLERRFDQIVAHNDKLDAKIYSNHRWTLGCIVACTIAIICFH